MKNVLFVKKSLKLYFTSILKYIAMEDINLQNKNIFKYIKYILESSLLYILT